MSALYLGAYLQIVGILALLTLMQAVEALHNAELTAAAGKDNKVRNAHNANREVNTGEDSKGSH